MGSSAALLFFAIPSPGLSTLPAFPGAEGSGALAKGGRGGVVCEVINLNDSGPGSLRACAEMSGPRTVIFGTSGTIVLKSPINIVRPYITIAGQTAPGGGIQVAAKAPGTFPIQQDQNGNHIGPSAENRGPSLISISTHDVVIRYLRLRPGYTGPAGTTASGQIGGVGIGSNAHDVILDHLSINWWTGVAVGMWDNPNGGPTRTLRRISVQNSLMSESLGFRFGILVGSTERYENAGENMGDIDLHRNMLSTTYARFPLIGRFSGEARLTNNIFYNTYGNQTGVRSADPPKSGLEIDVIGNLYDLGPTPKSSSRGLYPVTIERNDEYPSKVYVSGNWSDVHGYDDFNMVTVSGSASGSQTPNNPAPAIYRKSTPNPTPAIPIPLVPVDELEDHILPAIGASRRLDCEGNWTFNRDSVDVRVIEDGYKSRRAAFFIEHEDQVGGFPAIERGIRCVDTSADGIPDAWLIRNGLGTDLSEPIGSRFHDSGFTFLELYLNGMHVNDSWRKAPASPPGGVTVQ